MWSTLRIDVMRVINVLLELRTQGKQLVICFHSGKLKIAVVKLLFYIVFSFYR